MLDPEYVATVLADAAVIGDTAAARKWGISRWTVWNYRKRSEADPAIKQILTDKRARDARDYAELRVAFLREAIEILRQKAPKANVRALADAVKVIGELHQTATVVEGERVDSPDPEDPAPQGRPREGQGVASGH